MALSQAKEMNREDASDKVSDLKRRFVIRQQVFISVVAISWTLLLGFACKKKPEPTPPPPKPATTATAPATTTAATTKPGPPRTYIGVVKLAYPECAATQPLESPLDRKDAARVVLREPI